MWRICGNSLNLEQSGPQYFVEVDVVMPADTPLWKAHDLSQQLQDKIEVLPNVGRAFVHVDHETTHTPVSEGYRRCRFLFDLMSWPLALVGTSKNNVNCRGIAHAPALLFRLKNFSGTPMNYLSHEPDLTQEEHVSNCVLSSMIPSQGYEIRHSRIVPVLTFCFVSSVMLLKK